MGRPKGYSENASIFEVLFAIIAPKKLAYASLSVLIILGGVLVVSQYTLPGNPLFSIKKATEYSQAALLPGVDQSKYSLAIANKRLSDLSAIVSTKKTDSIQDGIQEFKDSVSNVAGNLNKNDRPALQQIATRVESLGAMINNSQEGAQLNSALAPLVQKEILDLDASTLTDSQMKQLQEIKALYDQGAFASALENILLITK